MKSLKALATLHPSRMTPKWLSMIDQPSQRKPGAILQSNRRMTQKVIQREPALPVPSQAPSAGRGGCSGRQGGFRGGAAAPAGLQRVMPAPPHVTGSTPALWFSAPCSWPIPGMAAVGPAQLSHYGQPSRRHKQQTAVASAWLCLSRHMQSTWLQGLSSLHLSLSVELPRALNLTPAQENCGIGRMGATPPSRGDDVATLVGLEGRALSQSGLFLSLKV